MIKKKIRQCAALLMIVMIFAVHGFPVFAAETLEKDGIMVEKVKISPIPEFMTLMHGPQIDENGCLTMELGKKYDFTLETEYSWEGQNLTGFSSLNAEFRIGNKNDDQMMPSYWMLGDDLWGDAATDMKKQYEVFVRCEEMELVPVQIDMVEGAEKRDVQLGLKGHIEIEIRVFIKRVATLEYSQINHTSSIQSIYQMISSRLNETTEFQEPKEAIYRMGYDCDLILGEKYPISIKGTTDYATNRFVLCPNLDDVGINEKAYQWTVEYEEETYTMDAFKGSGDDVFAYWNSPVVINSFVIHEVEFSPYIMEEEDDEGKLKTVVTTATGAAAAGLGASAAANALSGVQVQTSPVVRKREDEEEDSPDVSMSLYKPFKALVNTKGAAANLSITIDCTETLEWHFIPTAVCLDGLTAVVPTVTKIGNEATLVLTLTGAEMKNPHSTIYVTVVAWARTIAGNTIKTSASAEITLHRKGLEVQENEDGSLKVTAYTDSNLDGIAEIIELKSEEYFVKKKNEYTIIIEAKDKNLGSYELDAQSKKV